MATRRTVLRGGAAAAIVAATSVSAVALATDALAEQQQQPLAGHNPVPRPHLPKPTGRHPVGTTMLHLVDVGRPDPLAPTPRARELMVQLWYPGTAHGPVAAYLQAGISTQYAQAINVASGTSYPDDLLAFPTHSRRDVPTASGPRRPVLLFSHGYGISSAMSAGLLEDLASHGYIVAGIEHTFDAGAVEFPGGRVEVQKPDRQVDDVLRGVRLADTRLVLDSLAALAVGRNPDAERRSLPRGLGRALDLRHVGGFGFSLGAPTMVEAMRQDQRIHAGACLDGDLAGPGFDQPFLMMGNPSHARAVHPEWTAFYDRLRGPRLWIVVEGTEHADFCDVTVLRDDINLSALFENGPIDGSRALAIQRAYVAAWFDQALLGRPSRLLRNETATFPEVDFQA